MEKEVYKQFRIENKSERIPKVIEFLNSSEIQVSGVHVSKILPSYCIAGVISDKLNRGLILKEEELVEVNKVLSNGFPSNIDKSLIEANLRHINEAISLERNNGFVQLTFKV